MTTAARGARSASQLPPPGAAQSATNRLEQVFVQHLLDNTVEALTDRSGTPHPFPWSPDQNVRVGVLGPTFAPPPDPTANGDAGDGDDESDAAAPGRPVVVPPIDNRGVIGVDFVVTGDVTSVDLDIDVEFALYHPLLPPFTDINAEAQTRAAAVGGNRRRRPTVPVNPAWRRDDRHVTFTITVPVSADEAQIESTDLAGGDPLLADVATAVATHFTDPDALFKLTNNQTLPVAAALGTEVEFRQALAGRRDTSWQPLAPEPHLTVTTMPTIDGNIAVSVSLTNATVLADRAIQDLAVYDTRLTVTVAGPTRLQPQRLGFAEDDVRYAEVATVVGRGRGCVARPGDRPNVVVAETLPLHIQQHAQTLNHGADIKFTSLAGSYAPTLDALAAAMRTFLRGWDYSAAVTTEERDQITKLRDSFEVEVERFELGCDLLRNDPHLDRAFTLANRTFAAAKGPTAGWRLFQLVFMVTEMGALAGRENPTDPRLREELDAVDVLWFPTGGGKTEAYLGLITVALFYDRLRGKECGTTAWMLFPLRMLSVQQLARISEVVHHGEVIRAAEGIGGDPFTLGYLVGAANTPNNLARPAPNGWWPGIDAFAKLTPAERDERRLVGACPACNNRDSVGLDVNIPDQRLVHVCRNASCGHELAIHASDEEVTRYQPSVVVSTVDKITHFARNGQLTSFNRGPRMRCPKHGYYTHKACVAADCNVNVNTHTTPTGFKDPTPALWIQDELHLVREELGVFAGHYHTLMAELAVGAGHESSKVIAATATIEQFEDQLSQVYGRTPRMFPTGGGTLERSFYTEVTESDASTSACSPPAEAL